MRIALIGYGKMGKAIEEIALERGHEVVIKFDVESAHTLSVATLQENKVEVAIEFTNPHAAFDNLKICFEAQVPVVCGSTGWLDQFEAAKQLCLSHNSAFLYASNFSIGVNIFFALNKKLAELMKERPEYDVMLKEVHHTQKKDAPSGTAITLAQQVLAQLDRKTQWVNEPAGTPTQLSILSERTDPAPGTHHVRYCSDIDDIEIIHTAHSRKGFATGAVLAAEFLNGKKGNFSMQDVLGL